MCLQVKQPKIRTLDDGTVELVVSDVEEADSDSTAESVVFSDEESLNTTAQLQSGATAQLPSGVTTQLPSDVISQPQSAVKQQDSHVVQAPPALRPYTRPASAHQPTLTKQQASIPKEPAVIQPSTVVQEPTVRQPPTVVQDSTVPHASSMMKAKTIQQPPVVMKPPMVEPTVVQPPSSVVNQLSTYGDVLQGAGLNGGVMNNEPTPSVCSEPGSTSSKSQKSQKNNEKRKKGGYTMKKKTRKAEPVYEPVRHCMPKPGEKKRRQGKLSSFTTKDKIREIREKKANAEAKRQTGEQKMSKRRAAQRAEDGMLASQLQSTDASQDSESAVSDTVVEQPLSYYRSPFQLDHVDQIPLNFSTTDLEAADYWKWQALVQVEKLPYEQYVERQRLVQTGNTFTCEPVTRPESHTLAHMETLACKAKHDLSAPKISKVPTTPKQERSFVKTRETPPPEMRKIPPPRESPAEMVAALASEVPLPPDDDDDEEEEYEHGVDTLESMIDSDHTVVKPVPLPPTFDSRVGADLQVEKPVPLKLDSRVRADHEMGNPVPLELSGDDEYMDVDNISVGVNGVDTVVMPTVNKVITKKRDSEAEKFLLQKYENTDDDGENYVLNKTKMHHRKRRKVLPSDEEKDQCQIKKKKSKVLSNKDSRKHKTSEEKKSADKKHSNTKKKHKSRDSDTHKPPHHGHKSGEAVTSRQTLPIIPSGEKKDEKKGKLKLIPFKTVPRPNPSPVKRAYCKKPAKKKDLDFCQVEDTYSNDESAVRKKPVKDVTVEERLTNDQTDSEHDVFLSESVDEPEETFIDLPNLSAAGPSENRQKKRVTAKPKTKLQKIRAASSKGFSGFKGFPESKTTKSDKSSKDTHEEQIHEAHDKVGVIEKIEKEHKKRTENEKKLTRNLPPVQIKATKQSTKHKGVDSEKQIWQYMNRNMKTERTKVTQNVQTNQVKVNKGSNTKSDESGSDSAAVASNATKSHLNKPAKKVNNSHINDMVNADLARKSFSSDVVGMLLSSSKTRVEAESERTENQPPKPVTMAIHKPAIVHYGQKMQKQGPRHSISQVFKPTDVQTHRQKHVILSGHSHQPGIVSPRGHCMSPQLDHAMSPPQASAQSPRSATSPRSSDIEMPRSGFYEKVRDHSITSPVIPTEPVTYPGYLECNTIHYMQWNTPKALYIDHNERYAAERQAALAKNSDGVEMQGDPRLKDPSSLNKVSHQHLVHNSPHKLSHSISRMHSFNSENSLSDSDVSQLHMDVDCSIEIPLEKCSDNLEPTLPTFYSPAAALTGSGNTASHKETVEPTVSDDILGNITSGVYPSDGQKESVTNCEQSECTTINEMMVMESHENISNPQSVTKVDSATHDQDITHNIRDVHIPGLGELLNNNDVKKQTIAVSDTSTNIMELQIPGLDELQSDHKERNHNSTKTSGGMAIASKREASSMASVIDSEREASSTASITAIEREASSTATAIASKWEASSTASVSSEREASSMTSAIASKGKASSTVSAISNETGANSMSSAIASEREASSMSSSKASSTVSAISNEKEASSTVSAISIEREASSMPFAISIEREASSMPFAISSEREASSTASAIASEREASSMASAIASKGDASSTVSAISSEKEANSTASDIANEREASSTSSAIDSEREASFIAPSIASKKVASSTASAKSIEREASSMPFTMSSEKDASSSTSAIASEREASSATKESGLSGETKHSDDVECEFDEGELDALQINKQEIINAYFEQDSPGEGTPSKLFKHKSHKHKHKRRHSSHDKYKKRQSKGSSNGQDDDHNLSGKKKKKLMLYTDSETFHSMVCRKPQTESKDSKQLYDGYVSGENEGDHAAIPFSAYATSTSMVDNAHTDQVTVWTNQMKQISQKKPVSMTSGMFTNILSNFNADSTPLVNQEVTSLPRSTSDGVSQAIRSAKNSSVQQAGLTSTRESVKDKDIPPSNTSVKKKMSTKGKHSKNSTRTVSAHVFERRPPSPPPPPPVVTVCGPAIITSGGKPFEFNCVKPNEKATKATQPAVESKPHHNDDESAPAYMVRSEYQKPIPLMSLTTTKPEPTDCQPSSIQHLPPVRENVTDKTKPVQVKQNTTQAKQPASVKQKLPEEMQPASVKHKLPEEMQPASVQQQNTTETTQTDSSDTNDSDRNVQNKHLNDIDIKKRLDDLANKRERIMIKKKELDSQLDKMKEVEKFRFPPGKYPDELLQKSETMRVERDMLKIDVEIIERKSRKVRGDVWCEPNRKLPAEVLLQHEKDKVCTEEGVPLICLHTIYKEKYEQLVSSKSEIECFEDQLNSTTSDEKIRRLRQNLDFVYHIRTRDLRSLCDCRDKDKAIDSFRKLQEKYR